MGEAGQRETKDKGRKTKGEPGGERKKGEKRKFPNFLGLKHLYVFLLFLFCCLILMTHFYSRFMYTVIN